MTLLDEIRSVLAGPALLGFDFDGTLAPIVSDPEAATPLPGVVDSLVSLASRDEVTVMVISGRAHADLIGRIGVVPGVLMVGEHGNDWGDDSKQLPAIREAIRSVREIADRVDGSFVEEKKRSVAFHYRNAEPGSAFEAVRALEKLGDSDGLSVLKGKKVIELSLGAMTKGQVTVDMAGGRPIVYFGDDITDETVFSVLGHDDVGVKVGVGETAARFRLPDPAAVADMLSLLA